MIRVGGSWFDPRFASITLFVCWFVVGVGLVHSFIHSYGPSLFLTFPCPHRSVAPPPESRRGRGTRSASRPSRPCACPNPLQAWIEVVWEGGAERGGEEEDQIWTVEDRTLM